MSAFTVGAVGDVGAQPKPAAAPAPAAKPAATGAAAAAPATTTPPATSATPAASAAPAAAGASAGTSGATAAPAASSTAKPPTAAPTQATTTLAQQQQKSSPPPPPPTAQQIAAYQALRAETDAYEQGARDYRDTVTTIIRLHYEAKKKEILAGLDDEIKVEKGELKKARAIAIKRLEQFVATYTGSRADPSATPDAMYRLAALYEENARDEDATEDLSVGLKPAIALYKRILNEFPSYKRIAGVYYFLAHAYDDSGRIEESQQVYRSSVCHNHYPYPTAANPKNPEQDTIGALPQDNTQEYWDGWRATHPDPNSLKKGGPDTTYVDPYPADCQPLPQPDLLAGEEPKYVPEIWWQIGQWEFNNLDFGGGVTKEYPGAVWDYNRAASAYQHALAYKTPAVVHQVALYGHAWTLFKQQRYEAAVHEYVNLLNYTDEQAKLTGDPGASFKAEAATYIAEALANIDFAGPGPNEPYIQRPDIVDLIPDPVKAGEKLHVAIDRVRDPSLIPQDKSWTSAIYLALAEEFRSLNQFENAIEVYNDMLKKWPMDPSAPNVQYAIAETYDQMNVTKGVGTPEHDQIAAEALKARTLLANYIGNTPWVDANKDNPDALANAERLVKGGLKQAAAQHTNNAIAALNDANNTSDATRQLDSLKRAREEYKLAALGWGGYLHQDENAPDAYESRYWLAQALESQVEIEVLLERLKQGPPPSPQEIATAKAAAVDVRDSNEDDKYLMNAAVFVVRLADVDRDIAYQQFVDSNGQVGIEQRQTPRWDTSQPNQPALLDPIPPQILGSMQARDEYVQRVPKQLDVANNALENSYWTAEQYYLYGHFEDATQRFLPMYQEHCGKDKYGYVAWVHLITMSNHKGDVDTSRKLAEAEKAHPCAISEDEKAQASLIVDPTLQEAAYAKARKAFEDAQKAQPGPDRDRLWREAAGLYEAALQAAPSRDEAPEGAINAAYAYKQVGEFNKAIDMYGKFISEYGSEDKLTTLQKGGVDPKTKAKITADPKKYGERLSYLGNAYDALATTYFSFFNYQRAAETKEKVSGNPRFDEKTRKDAAQSAMELYNALGQRDKMLAQYKILTSLHPAPEEQAKADYSVADYDFKQWNPQGGDAGGNRATRLAAETALMSFFTRNHAKPAAARQSLEAAYQIAKMKKTVGDPQYHGWLKTVINSWEFLDRNGGGGKDGKYSQQAPYPDYAAEAEYTLLDEEIHEKYDYDTGHHHFTGSIPDVLGKYDDKTGKSISKGAYQKDAELADKYDKALEHIARTYQSLEWVPAAIARQGSLYDDLRTGLYNTVPPQLKYFTPQQEALLKKLENSGRDDLMAKADDIRSSVKEGWRNKKESELAAMDQLMVRRYATSVTLARAYNVRNPAVQRAINRLAYFTDIIGNDKMRGYVTGTANPINKSTNLAYADDQFVQQRPGLAATPPPDANAEPLPVAP